VIKKLNILYNLVTKLDNINTNYKLIRKPKKTQTKNTGFPGFYVKKTKLDRTEDGRFEPILV
jgi:hypothetical protein